jgi:EmrB/QacA subfamily drug resistance transporter
MGKGDPGEEQPAREVDMLSASQPEGIVPEPVEGRERLAASRAIPLTVGACFFMEGLDATIIATSLPQIAEALAVTPHETGVALTAYLISLSVGMAASGWLADRFDARRVFIASIAIFMLGSLVCGLSGSLAQLIAGRFLQGIGGAMMTPVGRLILALSFPREQLIRAMSYMLIPGLLGPMLGPVIGGAITTYFDWRWIFFINLPLGALGIGMALRFLAAMPAQRRARFDLGGFLLIAVALGSIQVSLEILAAESAFGGPTLVGLIIGLLACAVYARHARRPDPILDLRLFRYRSFAVAVLGGSLSRLVFGATMFIFPLYFQLGMGVSPIDAGYLMAVLALGQIALRLAIDPLLKHLGVKRLLIANSLALGAILPLLLAFRTHSAFWPMAGFLFVFGMLQAIHLSTLGGLNFSGIPTEVMGRATSIAAVVQRVAMALGISFAAILLGYAGAGIEAAYADFIPPVLALAAIMLLSTSAFFVLRKGDGEDLIGKR